MAPRAPLAKGDDGSSNRYPARHLCPVCFIHHGPFCPRNTEDVPAALIASTPERLDPPCGGDNG